MAGISSIGYIAILLFLVFYLFAVMGMLLFKESDPAHFSGLGHAMVSLFRAATMEDWSDLMYVSIYGCDPNFGYPAAPPRGRWLCASAHEQSLIMSPIGQVAAVMYWVRARLRESLTLGARCVAGIKRRLGRDGGSTRRRLDATAHGAEIGLSLIHI